MHPLELRPDDERVTWDGVARLDGRADWWQPWRLTADQVAGTLSPEVLSNTRTAAGVRFGFRTDAHEVRVDLKTELWGPLPKPLDVLVDGVLAHRLELSPGVRTVVVALPGSPVDVELWLPHWCATVGVGPLRFSGTAVRPLRRTGPRLVAYGSSITQCVITPGPSETWPALVARERGWRLRNLGYAGQAYLDHALAVAVGDTPADVVVVELGVNLYIRGPFDRRTLGSAVTGFLRTIRAANPHVPVVAFSPLVSVSREDVPNVHDLTLAQVRERVHEAVEFVRRDDGRITLVDGADLFGAADAHLAPDGLHPDARGDAVIASRLGPVLAAALDG